LAAPKRQVAAKGRPDAVGFGRVDGARQGRAASRLRKITSFGCVQVARHICGVRVAESYRNQWWKSCFTFDFVARFAFGVGKTACR
jgi:hypothetical protein